jgi:hypothetical protein
MNTRNTLTILYAIIMLSSSVLFSNCCSDEILSRTERNGSFRIFAFGTKNKELFDYNKSFSDRYKAMGMNVKPKVGWDLSSIMVVNDSCACRLSVYAIFKNDIFVSGSYANIERGDTSSLDRKWKQATNSTSNNCEAHAYKLMKEFYNGYEFYKPGSLVYYTKGRTCSRKIQD